MKGHQLPEVIVDASYGLIDLATCQAAKCVPLQLYFRFYIQLIIDTQFMDRFENNQMVPKTAIYSSIRKNMAKKTPV